MIIIVVSIITIIVIIGVVAYYTMDTTQPQSYPKPRFTTLQDNESIDAQDDPQLTTDLPPTISILPTTGLPPTTSGKPPVLKERTPPPILPVLTSPSYDEIDDPIGSVPSVEPPPVEVPTPAPIIKASYGRGAGVGLICPPGYVNEGGFCYSEPKSGYNCFAETCTKTCPEGMRDDGFFCSKNTSTRATTPAAACPSGMERDGTLCYAPCKNGFTPVGPVCWGKCPEGYSDDGALCTRPPSIIQVDRYQRNIVGTPPQYQPCPAGYETYPLTCTKCETKDEGYNAILGGCGFPWAPCPVDGSVGCGPTCNSMWVSNIKLSCDTKNRVPTCASDEELIDGLCYKKCRDGYTSGRDDILFCSRRSCPPGYRNDGLTCARDVHTVPKESYGRGAGTPLICGLGLEAGSAGLCYPPCPKGTTGVGPVCWEECPTGWTSSGVGCTKPLYNRGMGVTPSVCPDGTVSGGPGSLLCYPECQTGYKGDGPVCWEQ
jgi:hypothetical protein